MILSASSLREIGVWPGGTAFSGDGDSTMVFGVLAVVGRRLRRGHDFSPSARMPRGAQSAKGFVRSDRDCL